MRRPQGAFSLPGTLVLQELPRSTSCNVHGVRAEFLALGRHAAEPEHEFSEGAYFIGKLLWAKGHGLLIDYLAGEEGVRVDLYGNGEDSEKVQAKAAEAAVDLRFFSGRDHSDESLHAYKVFVNPSQTEVLSTTTAEALAMGNLVGGQAAPGELESCHAISHAISLRRGWRGWRAHLPRLQGMWQGMWQSEAWLWHATARPPSPSEPASFCLAGKFAVIERRPENAFFEQFANVFTYETPEQVCAVQCGPCMCKTARTQHLCSACAAAPVEARACAVHMQYSICSTHLWPARAVPRRTAHRARLDARAADREGEPRAILGGRH